MDQIHHRPRIHPLYIIAVGILAGSTASIFVRNAQVYVPSFVIAAYRLSIATLVLMPVAITVRRSELKTLTRKNIFLAALSGIFLALHFATWITSLEYTTVASSVVIVATVPIWVALLSPVTIKEKVAKPVLIGLAVAMAGVFLVAMSDACNWMEGRLFCPSWSEFKHGRAIIGDLLALLGAFSGAGYVLMGRRLRTEISLISYAFVVYGAAALVLILIMLMVGQSPVGYPPIAYVWLILLALVPQLLGHSSYNWALGYLSAAYVSVTLLGEPIAATLLAYFLLGETPTEMKIFGAILILIGIYIASRFENL
jgi:drug/metabolite transporter (DMT)-like permease